MKQTFSPGWLVQLLNMWALRDSPGHQLGYPTKSHIFSEKTTGGYNHSTPCSVTGIDFSDLEECLDRLKEERLELFLSLTMYYKPHSVNAIKADGWAWGNSTYYKRLHTAHDLVALHMKQMRENRLHRVVTVE